MEVDVIYRIVVFVIVMTLAMLMYNVMVPKIQESGNYIIYKDKIYKEVPEEELDNIIILEVK